MELPRVDLTEAGEFTEDIVAEMILFSAVALLLFLSDATCNRVGVTGGVEHGSSGKVDNVGFGTGVDEAEVNDAATGGVPMLGEGIEISSSML
jgi:hypothetical protein